MCVCVCVCVVVVVVVADVGARLWHQLKLPVSVGHIFPDSQASPGTTQGFTDVRGESADGVGSEDARQRGDRVGQAEQQPGERGRDVHVVHHAARVLEAAAMATRTHRDDKWVKDLVEGATILEGATSTWKEINAQWDGPLLKPNDGACAPLVPDKEQNSRFAG